MKPGTAVGHSLLLIAMLIPGPVCSAQNSGTQSSQPGNMPNMASPPIRVRVSGCLKRGNESGGFYLKDENGRTWEIIPANGVNLADHINQSVVIIGRPAELGQQQETQKESSEQAEGAGTQHSDLRVMTIEMLSPSCTR